MFTEKKANKLFWEHYNYIIENLIGHESTTYGNDLYIYGKKLFGDKFRGVYTSDKIPKIKQNESMILNLDDSKHSGSHWISVIGSNSKFYIYDSFGRNTFKIIPSLLEEYPNILMTDDDPEQKKNQSNCGQLSLTWLLFFYKYGYKNALLI